MTPPSNILGSALMLGSGGGVQTARVTVSAGTVYYTDASMTYQEASGIVYTDMPIGTLVVTEGPAPMPAGPDGVTQILSYRGFIIYEVTG